jgi:HK97 family phage prohead protease
MLTLEVRDVGDAWSVSGVASTWDRPYFVVERDGSAFRETVERGAFDSAISGIDSVDLRVEHDADGPRLASTDRGSLSFADSDAGLLLAAALSKHDRDAQEAVRRVQERDLRGLSVGMRVHADERGLDSDGRTELRRIYRASLSEVSLVRAPANPFATISDVRGERRAEGRVEWRYMPFANVRQWANQHGQECDTCEGSGNCPDCGGEGWTRKDGSDNSSGDDTTAGRVLLAPDDLRLELEWLDARAGRSGARRSGVTLAPNDTDELLEEFWRSQLRRVA